MYKYIIKKQDGTITEIVKDEPTSMYGYMRWEDFVGRYDTSDKLEQLNDVFVYSHAPNWTFNRYEIYESGILLKLWNWVTGKEYTYKWSKYVGFEEIDPYVIEHASEYGIHIVGGKDEFENWLYEYISIANLGY